MNHRALFERAYQFGYDNPDAPLETFIREHATWDQGDFILLSYQFLHGQIQRTMTDKPEILNDRRYYDRREQATHKSLA